MAEDQDRKGFSILVCFLALLIGVACTSKSDQLKIGERLPRIELNDLRGSKVAIPDDFKSKVVLIRFWADCCSYNINEMSFVDSVLGKYGERGLAVITIHTGGPKKVAEDFATMLKIRFPVLLDSDSKVAKQCGIQKLPSTFIIDRGGVVRAKIDGEAEDPKKKFYEDLITPLL